MIIAISGIDCAGKGTQIALLDRALARLGHRVRTFWFRPGYSAELNALRRLVRALGPGALPTSEHPEARARAFERTGIKPLWLAMALADSVLQYALKVRAMSLCGDVVICDRYLDDALLDLELRFPEIDVRRWPAVRIVQRLIPEPDLQILLRIGHEEMLRRMAIKNEPFPDPPEIRDRRHAAYCEMAALKRPFRHVIDAERPIEAIHDDLLRGALAAYGARR